MMILTSWTIRVFLEMSYSQHGNDQWPNRQGQGNPPCRPCRYGINCRHKGNGCRFSHPGQHGQQFQQHQRDPRHHGYHGQQGQSPNDRAQQPPFDHALQPHGYEQQLPFGHVQQPPFSHVQQSFGHMQPPFDHALQPHGYAQQLPFGHVQQSFGHMQPPFSHAQQPHGYAQQLPFGHVQQPPFSHVQQSFGHMQPPFDHALQPHGYAQQLPFGHVQQSFGHMQPPFSHAQQPHGYAQQPLDHAQQPFHSYPGNPLQNTAHVAPHGHPTDIVQTRKEPSESTNESVNWAEFCPHDAEEDEEDEEDEKDEEIMNAVEKEDELTDQLNAFFNQFPQLDKIDLDGLVSQLVEKLTKLENRFRKTPLENECNTPLENECNMTSELTAQMLDQLVVQLCNSNVTDINKLVDDHIVLLENAIVAQHEIQFTEQEHDSAAGIESSVIQSNDSSHASNTTSQN